MILDAYRIEREIPADKTITLTGLPFAPGEHVEILITRQTPRPSEEAYPLRGQPVRYEQTFKSVAEEDWDTLQ